MKKTYNSAVSELPVGEINIIPIVDVSFCLVIFCLVAMNIMLTAGINVLEAKTGGQSAPIVAHDNVSVILTQDNKILLNNHEIAPVDLPGQLAALIPATKDKMVLVTAHESNTCEQVVNILDIAKKCGAQRLALVNNPPHAITSEAPKRVVAKKHHSKGRKRKMRA
ncbi:MAG: biopolymer transporter ExbD [Endomicrobiales bacterium]